MMLLKLLLCKFYSLKKSKKRFFFERFFCYTFLKLNSLFILYSFFIHSLLWFIALIVFVPVLLFLKILFNHYFHPKLTFKVLLVNVLPVSMRLLDPLDLTFAPHFFINTSLFTLTTILFPPLKTLTTKSLSLGLHSHHLKNLIGVFVFDFDFGFDFVFDFGFSNLTTFHALLLFHFLIFLLFPYLYLILHFHLSYNIHYLLILLFQPLSRHHRLLLFRKSFVDDHDHE